MTRHGKPGPAVVGVDEAGSAEDAVDWTTAEAAARSSPLCVEHAFRRARQQAPPCPIVVIRPFTNRPADRVFLRSAPRVIAGVDPAASRCAAVGFAFHAASQRDIPLIVLSAWTPDTAADIEPTHLVVGSSSRGHLRGLLCGSVSRTVLRDAGCPVAIVGRDRTTAGRTTAGRMTAPLTRAEHGAVLQSGSTGRPRHQEFWIHRASQ